MVNVRLAELHGRPSEKHGHALYLDGPEMRTTAALLQKGWPPERLHVPNCCEHDFKAMQAKATGVNLYHCTSTRLLKELLINQSPVTHSAAQDHSQSGTSEDWVTSLQQEGVSPFSLVYLDYTNVRSRQEDLSLLLGRGLLKSGVLAITCPARAPDVPESRDRHIEDEQAQTMDGRLQGIDGELAGLAKVQVELRMACTSANRSNAPSNDFGWCGDVTTEPVEVLTYTGKKTRMWVATFAVMPDRTADRSFDIGFSGLCNSGFSGFAMHPELDRALLDIGAHALCYPELNSFNPAARRGMDGERLMRVANSVAREEFGLSSWAIVLKIDGEEREQQREWDFLVAVYGEQQANVIGSMHPLDMHAFSLYIRGYDMWRCDFKGDMEAVIEALEKSNPRNQSYSVVDKINMKAGIYTSSPRMARLTITVLDGFPGDMGRGATRELCRVYVPTTATVADLYKKVDPFVPDRVLSYMMRPLDYANEQNDETLASLGITEDTTLRAY
jgi:hypothetical protein